MSGIAGKNNGIRERNHCKVNYIYSGRKRDTHRSIMDIETLLFLHFGQRETSGVLQGTKEKVS